MKTVYSVIFLPCLIILIFLVTSVNGTSEWVEYGKSTDGSVYLYNKVRIKHMTKNLVQVWKKQVFSDEGREEYIQFMRKNGQSTEGLEKLSYNLSLIEINCKTESYWILSITHHDTNGDVISFSTDKTDWDYIVSGSMMDTLRKEVCK